MSTFINDLPYQSNNGSGNQPSSGMNPTVVNQIINEINEVSMKGETLLPTRDIPMQQNIDEEAMPNYVPGEGEKFIQESDKNVIQTYNNRVTRSEKLDKIYDELQTPILLSILYFLFQLPIFKNFMFTLFPFMFSKDGNANIQGYFGFSFLFGVFYYFISKLMLFINF
jgi:hypothetical protein